MKSLKPLVFIIIFNLFTIPIITTSCSNSDDTDQGTEADDNDDQNDDNIASSPNILLIIADDMGFDATNGFSEGDQKPFTPHLDSIMNNGLTFTNFWVNPTCAPTRASIISGTYGNTTGVLEVGDALPPEHTVLQSYINQNTANKYATAVIGKWHIADTNNFNPENLGIDYYAGLLSGAANSYTSWDFTEDGVTTTETDYITKKFTDLSISWVQEQTQPWFLWLAYTAPHRPFHLPPSEMHSQGDLPNDNASIDANPLPYYLAAIEAMDYQIGELLNAMSPEKRNNTQIIFIGDNGTPGPVAQSPYTRFTAKGSMYEGGINTPMFISGPSTTRTGTDASLINGTDLYATIAGIAGVTIENIHDSKNFTSLLTEANLNFRDYIYAEVKDDNTNLNAWSIRNNTYKLIEYIDGSQEFYNLISDPYENIDLLENVLSSEEVNNKDALETELTTIRQ